VSDTDRPLRILLVSANYKPSVGGIEQYVENLAHGLAARGHSVTVAACRTNGGAKQERDGGVDIVRIPATDVLDQRLNVPYPVPNPVAAWRTLKRLIADADVVHAHDALYATSVLSLELSRRADVPAVLTQHVAFVPQRRRALDAAERAAIATLGRSARLAKRVVSYNPAVADWATETWSLDEVRVLPPGVPAPGHVDRNEVRLRYGLPRDRLLALFAGRDVTKKGLEVFLAAGDPAYELVAVTDGDPSSAPKGTRILPFVDPVAFRELLASVDAFVLPSEAEGFPLSLQEALVTGLPCVVTPGPGYERYLRTGETISIRRDASDIRAALLRLAGDDSLRRELGERARGAGRREFGLEPFVSAYEDLYREVLS